MRDTIYRQDVIKAVHRVIFSFFNFGEDEFPMTLEDKKLLAINKAISAEIKALQSAERKGKWIRNDNGTYSCSFCQSWIPEEQYYYARFCLHCGASMERGEEK